jgi:hypothetical protein
MGKRDQKPKGPPVVLNGEQVMAMNANKLRRLLQSGEAIIDPDFMKRFEQDSKRATREAMREIERARALKLIKHQLR